MTHQHFTGRRTLKLSAAAVQRSGRLFPCARPADSFKLCIRSRRYDCSMTRRRIAGVLHVICLAILLLVAMGWATSYRHFRFISHDGRLLVVAVRPSYWSEEWLRLQPASFSVWKK